MLAGVGVELPGGVVVAAGVELDEPDGLLEQLRRLALDVRGVVGLRLLDQLLLVGVDLDVVVGPGDREVLRIPSPVMPGLQAVT